MTQQEPAPPGEDPSMEDILASIRRILNDEGEPAPAPQADAPAPQADAPTSHQAPADDDVFLLDQTMLIEDPAPMPPEPAPPYTPPAPDPFDDDQFDPPRAAAPPQLPPEPAPDLARDYSHLDAGEPPEEPLLAASTAAAASASLGALVRVVGQRNMPVYRGGPSLEDMVRDEIRPLVKSWLDEHLAPMVERLVRSEIERVTRGQK